jgi:hypothetical protein
MIRGLKLGSLLAGHKFTTPKANIFDMYAVKDKNSSYQPQDTGNTCGGLAWEKTYM